MPGLSADDKAIAMQNTALRAEKRFFKPSGMLNLANSTRRSVVP